MKKSARQLQLYKVLPSGAYFFLILFYKINTIQKEIKFSTTLINVTKREFAFMVFRITISIFMGKISTHSMLRQIEFLSGRIFYHSALFKGSDLS
jgi:hypothetical protein